MSAAPIRILTVDDHPLLHQGLAAVISAQPDMTIVGNAATGAEAVARFRALQPDVTLMDLQLPDMSGVDAIRAIRRDAPEARIIVLTMYDGDVLAAQAIKAGAAGYMLKSMVRKELLDTIRAVHAGRRRIPPEIAMAMAEHLADESLSPRELHVLRLLAVGSSNQVIARALAISAETVKVHVSSILSKLHANDRTHAVAIGLRRGILGPHDLAG